MRPKPSECREVRLPDIAIRFAAESHYMVFYVVSPLYTELLPDAQQKTSYQDKGSDSWPDPTDDIDNAHCLMQGSVKWDGCMDYVVGQDGSLHVCGLDQALKLAHAISAVYAIAAQHIAAFNPMDAL